MSRTSHMNRGLMVEKPKNFKQSWGKLMRYIRPFYVMSIVALIFIIAAVIIRVLGPEMVGDLAGKVTKGGLPNKDVMDEITQIGMTLVIMYISMFILSIVQQWIMAGVTQKVGKNLRRDISKKINRLPLSYFDTHQTGDIISRVSNDVDTLCREESLLALPLFARPFASRPVDAVPHLLFDDLDRG